LRIVVAGYMVRHPLVGMMMAFAQYLSALKELGHDVVYLEESGWGDACYHPSKGNFDNDPKEGLASVRRLLDALLTVVPIYYFRRDTTQLWTGLEISGGQYELEQLISQSDLLLNVGGVCALPEFELAPCRALIDLDPLFTQVGKFAGDDIDIYHQHFTYGCNLGKSTCKIPTAGIVWKPTVPPVNVSFWQNAATSIALGSAYTTIANWSAYGGIEYKGEWYGQKDTEFIKLLELPGKTDADLELALAGADDATLNQFNSAGWSIRSSIDLSSNLADYCHYIIQSRGEFSAAKHAYVVTRSGWFSDRTVCYLASGRPVVVQDTGIKDWLDFTDGVCVFNDLDTAADAIGQVQGNYARHSIAARELANDVFGHTTVLKRILSECSLA